MASVIERLPFGIGAVDLNTEGGWLVGRVNLLTGRPKTGKTTVAGYALASFHTHDKRRAWLYNGEYKLSLDWLVKLGADAARMEIRPPQFLEEVCDEIIYTVMAAEGTDVGFVFIDGIRMIPSQVRDGVGEKSSVAYSPISPEAHILNRFFAKVALYQAKRIWNGHAPVTLFIVNHETRGMPVGDFAAPIVIPGGTVQLFAAGLRIRFVMPQYLGKRTVEGMEIATRVEFNFTVEANLGGRSQNSGVFRMYQTERTGEIDEVEQYIAWGEQVGFLKASEKNVTVDGEEIGGEGRPALVAYWRTHPQQYDIHKQEIMRQVQQFLADLPLLERKKKGDGRQKKAAG